MKRLKLFIDNSWSDAADGATFESTNPATGETVAVLAKAGKSDVDRAVGAAKKAFDSGVWSRMDPDGRADLMLKAANIMRKRFDELAELEAMDSGKPIRETRLVDIPYAIRAMEYFANMSREIKGEVIPLPGDQAFDWVSFEPYGVVAAITPWNFPLHLATRAICPAIATGNCVVAKPSSLAPVTTVLLGEILLEAGFPPGVVNILSGPGGSTGDALVGHADVRMITFTGSVEIGRRVMGLAATSPIIKKVLLELGGKGPFIAEADCDVDAAVNSLIPGFCLVEGQVCCASTRLYLHEAIYDEFMDNLVRKVDSLRFGDIMDPETQIGSLISSDQLKTVDGYVKQAVEAGARLVYGGEQVTTPPCDKGSFYKPTILEVESNDLACVREEVFGPVLTVKRYGDIDEAIALANDTDYGLGATVYSSNPRTLFRAAKEIDAGMVWLNTNVMSKIEAPYGGNKNSGLGREDGTIGLKEYLKAKNNVLYLGKPEDDNFYGF